MSKVTMAMLAAAVTLAACGGRESAADTGGADTVLPMPTTQAPMEMSDSAPDSLRARGAMPVRGDSARKTTKKPGGPQPF